MLPPAGSASRTTPSPDPTELTVCPANCCRLRSRRCRLNGTAQPRNARTPNSTTLTACSPCTPPVATTKPIGLLVPLPRPRKATTARHDQTRANVRYCRESRAFADVHVPTSITAPRRRRRWGPFVVREVRRSSVTVLATPPVSHCPVARTDRRALPRAAIPVRRRSPR